MDLTKCQIFTPHSIVQYMLDYVGYTKSVYGKTVIDNSCGDGQFLIEIVRRFISDGLKVTSSIEDIKDALEKCVCGYEIDEKYYNECIENVTAVAAEFNIYNVKWNIHCRDGLNIDIMEGFDFVVMNPPYIAYKDLDVETREKVKEKFQSCKKGKFDYSYAFIEYGLELLSDNGKMIVISPSNMLKTVSGYTIRDIIKPYVNSIINCSQERIFNKVLTSPIVTYYEKNCTNQFVKYYKVRGGEEISIEKNDLHDKWTFEPIQKKQRRFGDCFVVANSIATLANDIFIHTADENGAVIIDGRNIENGILRVAKSPKSEKSKFGKRIIFPYRYACKGLEHMSENEIKTTFPQAYAYLKSKEIELEQRDSDSCAKWYEFGRSQALAHLNREKLMISSIVTGQVYVYQLAADEIPFSGMFVFAKGDGQLTDALNILTSKEFYQYAINIGVQLSGSSVRITTEDIENYLF